MNGHRQASAKGVKAMSIRIGFYICHCGINIAGVVRVDEVAAFARTQRNVVVSRDYKFMCSDPGQELIENDIRSYGLNRVVVASCSPRLHEKTFQKACLRAGLNPYYFQMASVREQVSWVTDNPDTATVKAKTLAAAALNRVNFHEHLDQRYVSIHPDVLVVGGGIAGMQSAIDIGNAGRTAWLVEKDTTIGGHMLQFDKTFPTLDCAACIGTPKMVETAQNPNINLLAFSEVEDVSGYIGNFSVSVRNKATYVTTKCTGCGECVGVCPVSMPSAWDVGLQDRRAIFRAFPQAVPIYFSIDKRKQAPCRTSCPAGTNVQGYVQMVKQGKYQEALNIIMERLPLPGVLGRVCPHPCETGCRRALIDSPIAIRELKRFAADHGDLAKVPWPDIPDRGERAAVIGSGPAGLTVAYYLRRHGIQVTLFEAMEKPGGMLRAGIPDYRLPPDLLDREIDHILDKGVELRCTMRLGRDMTLASLQQEGFDAVFLGLGTHSPVKMNIVNDEFSGVVDAVDFLRTVNFHRKRYGMSTAVVIGGGNVAMDAARVCLRSGAEKAIVVYRRTEQEMPADHEEILGAKQEGIEFIFLATPVSVTTDSGRVSGLECLVNEPGPEDESGRRRPVPRPGSEFVIPCDMIIPAIGQALTMDFFDRELQPEMTAAGTLQVNPVTMETSIQGVFAAGDAVTGPATVVEAVAAGHRAVNGILSHLGLTEIGAGENATEANRERQDWVPLPTGMAPVPRAVSRSLDPGGRLASFEEVDTGLDSASALQEAERCINCGGCCECMQCVTACQPGAIDHGQEDRITTFPVGSIITATGFDPMNPEKIYQYGYKTYPNVYTNLEFERLSNATGPTGGRILIRDVAGNFTQTPKSVAILHCIGSRDDHYHTYCSRVCCMYALKYGHLIHEKTGHDTQVFNFYIDMRCFGKGYEEFYIKCQEEGTVFIRGKAAQITSRAQSPGEQGKLIVVSEDTLLGEQIRVPVDMVILCTAMEARQDARDIGRVLGINQGADGFFLEEHPKLGPLNTASDGVFIAGACQGPKDIPDTVSQASGAAAKSLLLASRGEVEVSAMVSFIDPDVCAGCQTCIGLCPYSAIRFDERRQVSVVNNALCKGCGSCSGFCPSGAAQVLHFKEKQIFAELSGVMDAIHSL